MVVLIDLTDGGDCERRSELAVDKWLFEVTRTICQLIDVKTKEASEV